MTRTKLAVDMWEKSTVGNDRFNHMLGIGRRGWARARDYGTLLLAYD